MNGYQKFQADIITRTIEPALVAEGWAVRGRITVHTDQPQRGPALAVDGAVEKDGEPATIVQAHHVNDDRGDHLRILLKQGDEYIRIERRISVVTIAHVPDEPQRDLSGSLVVAHADGPR